MPNEKETSKIWSLFHPLLTFVCLIRPRYIFPMLDLATKSLCCKDGLCTYIRIYRLLKFMWSSVDAEEPEVYNEVKQRDMLSTSLFTFSITASGSTIILPISNYRSRGQGCVCCELWRPLIILDIELGVCPTSQNNLEVYAKIMNKIVVFFA